MNYELQRLQNLLPNDLLDRVTISSSIERQSILICTKKVKDRSYSIEIDDNDWQKIDLDYRNLLFWHEIARIQQHSIKSYRWESIVFTAGLGMSILEVTSQQVFLLSLYLLLTLVAGWQLYQNNRGESYLRMVTQADKQAIVLARQFGYSLPQAYRSLHGAIKILMQRSPQSLPDKQYQTRLQVLEINAIEQRKQIQHLTELSL
jgi:hypothetical protein